MVAFWRSSTDVLSELFSRYKQRLFASFRRRVADEPDPVAGTPSRSIRSWAGAPRLLEPLYDLLMGWDLSDPDMTFLRRAVPFPAIGGATIDLSRFQKQFQSGEHVVHANEKILGGASRDTGSGQDVSNLRRKQMDWSLLKQAPDLVCHARRFSLKRCIGLIEIQTLKYQIDGRQLSLVPLQLALENDSFLENSSKPFSQFLSATQSALASLDVVHVAPQRYVTYND